MADSLDPDVFDEKKEDIEKLVCMISHQVPSVPYEIAGCGHIGCK